MQQTQISTLTDRKTPTLFIDQYGRKIWARTVHELREKAGGGRVNKQYIDKHDGRTVHNGYVVGQSWFTAFRPLEIEA